MKYLKMILEVVINLFISSFLTHMIYLLMLYVFGFVVPTSWLILIVFIFAAFIDVGVD
mgnify:CR=1 FL=1|jgi:hypothetical protein